MLVLLVAKLVNMVSNLINVRRQNCRLLHQLTTVWTRLSSESKLAHIKLYLVNSRLIQQGLHTVKSPGGRRLWLFQDEATSFLYLKLSQADTEVHVLDGFIQFFLNTLWVSLMA